jgi:hypothetical protein
MEEPATSLDDCLEQGSAAVLAVAAALPSREDLTHELACVAAAAARGYFLPDEEELVRRRYRGYLSMRAVLLESLDELAAAAGTGGGSWDRRQPVFATAFATACVLARTNRFLTDLARREPVLWKKLDEEDEAAGVPRKSFTRIFHAATRPATLRLFLAATDYYFANREAIMRLGDDARFAAVTGLLAREEEWMERRRSDALRRLFAYRWFSFLRRHRSAWRRVMFGFFEASGRAISELRQPGVKPRGAPKRISVRMRAGLPPRLRPGDVFVTRHDDAMSNWFLPGHWPHTALYLGSARECDALGLRLPFAAGDGHWFLESKKDGVLFRPIGATLRVDAFLTLRPPLEGPLIAEALQRAMVHAGKPYDFLFDFRTSDRLACSEVVYRGLHGVGPVRFHLTEQGGRLCLSTEEFIRQALACGFEIVIAGGLGGDGLRYGEDAAAAYAALPYS